MIRRVLVCAAILLPLAARGAEPSAAAPAHDRAWLVQQLEQSRARFLAAVKGLTPEQANWRSAEGRWTIAEVAEHIVLAERTGPPALEEILKTPAAPEKKAEVVGKEEAIYKRLLDRGNKVKTNERLEPKNTFGSLEGSVKAFEEVRAQLLQIARTNDELRVHFAPHRFLGTLDAYQWLVFSSAHVARHTLQIEEVKAQPGFPK